MPAQTGRSDSRTGGQRSGWASGTLGRMLTTITTRNLGAATIVTGLLVTVFTLAGDGSDRPFVLAGLLVFVGVGLRLEAAVRARNAGHVATGASSRTI